MEVIVVVGAGLDVHKRRITACCIDGRISPPKITKRTFGTFRDELERLREWLVERGCTHVAMESTGVYWVPVYRILEGSVRIVLGNARHMANVPGRKTDVSDAHWIADLLRHGLIRPNFIPPTPIRELRQSTRYRRRLIEMRSASELRVEKLLQSTNIKLSSVATNIFGVSGRRMLAALADGTTDPVKLAGLAKGTLVNKRIELTRALRGTFTERDAELLTVELRVISDLQKQITQLNTLIETALAPFTEQMALLDTVPGIDRALAGELIAEIGTDMRAWPSAAHFAAWTGTCPGNRESAGVRRRARSRDGNPYVKFILLRAAVSASRTVTSYLAARYRRLAARRGQRRALVALAHEIGVSIYHMLAKGEPYRPPAAADPNVIRHRKAQQLIRQLRQLGLEVSTKPLA